MTTRGRLTLFVLSAVGLTAVLVASLTGLPRFGSDAGRYGRLINRSAAVERHVPEAVGAVTFDYRGIDSFGEESILFAAVLAVALVLREQLDEDDLPYKLDEDPGAVTAGETTETVRLVGMTFLPLVVLLGLSVIGHGHLTPGGGFQGGVVLASGLALLYVAVDAATFRTALPDGALEPVEAFGLSAYAVIGLLGLVFGSAVMDNFLPFGHLGRLVGGGTIPLLSVAVGIEVAAGTLLVTAQFIDQLVRVMRSRSAR
ncbi:MAG: hypothetical protein JWL70_2225 [Acidimicrobiia bacterium]|nr:hypothetical protein [Acidimicrobiia bacterium]